MIYNEIKKLKDMLTKANIPFVFQKSICKGYHIIYPEFDRCICSIIEHEGSYGYDDDLLEIMGLLTPEEQEHDDVVGYLTAEDVFKRIEKHWESSKKDDKPLKLWCIN